MAVAPALRKKLSLQKSREHWVKVRDSGKEGWTHNPTLKQQMVFQPEGNSPGIVCLELFLVKNGGREALGPSRLSLSSPLCEQCPGFVGNQLDFQRTPLLLLFILRLQDDIEITVNNKTISKGTGER